MIFKNKLSKKLFMATKGRMKVNNEWIISVNYKEISSDKSDMISTISYESFIENFEKIPFELLEEYSDQVKICIDNVYYWIPSTIGQTFNNKNKKIEK